MRNLKKHYTFLKVSIQKTSFFVKNVKEHLDLDLDYQNFEQQRHLVNTILMQFSYFLSIYELKNKFRFVTFDSKDGKK